MTKKGLNDKLLNASYQGNLDAVKYLLNSPNLKDHADINYKDKDGTNALIYASYKEHLEIVKYLLNSPDLKEHVNIHDKDNDGLNGLMYACKYGNIKIIKYLLTSSDLKEHADITHKDKNRWNSLMCACYNRHLEIAKYLIIDMNMIIDSETINWLQGENNKKEIYHDILNLIKARDLNNKLDISLKADLLKDNKKIKI